MSGIGDSAGKPATPRRTALSASALGVVLYMLAIATMSVMDLVAKTLSGHVPVLEVVWARYVGQSVIVIALLAPRLATVVRTRYPALQFLRSLFLLGGTMLFFFSLSKLGLAEASALMDTNPVLITLGAALFLGERVGPHRVAGIGAALVGALIIIRPGSSVFSPAAMMPLAAAVCYAGFALVTRFVGRDENPSTSLFYAGLLGAAVLSLAVPSVWVRPDGTALLLMLAIGAIGAAGQVLMIRAFTLAEASKVAPFSYVGLLFAAFWGWLFFGELPDLATWIGAGVIVSAGVYVWHRESGRARAAKLPTEAI